MLGKITMKRAAKKGGPMEKPLIEISPIDIPDEVTQVDLPEIGETTPHPKPDSPLAEGNTEGENNRRAGFIP
jgi:hypothetical protein